MLVTTYIETHVSVYFPSHYAIDMITTWFDLVIAREESEAAGRVVQGV